MRAASLARYFPAEGIRLDVLTTRSPAAVGTDESLLADIPAEVTVHRTITLDLPFGIKKRVKRLVTGKTPKPHIAAGPAGPATPSLLKRLVQELLVPDPQRTWLPVLTRAARRIVKEREIDLVLLTVPPFSSLLVVERLRKEFPHLAVVVDFRDEVRSIIETVNFNRSERNRRAGLKVEASAVTNATAVVAVTEAARLDIRARFAEQPESKFFLVPNGFDLTRLPGKEVNPALRRDDRIVVSHIGTVYISNHPAAVVAALQSLPPEIRARFCFRFIGHIEEEHFRDALLDLGEMVEFTGFQPQREALATLNEADYVLLINHDPINVQGKFYDYIGSGKPILGAVRPDGETRRLLDNLRAGWWAPVDDVQAIRQLFLDAAARGKAPFSDFKPDTERIAQYERKVLAKKYAALLHSIADASVPSHSQEP